ncbi:LuxR C-terminal-related transcriptional regulator [Flavobacterium sp. JP2137]|uniref:LuxR C-terminal-related transcriptional regulator n=1 Tax=Flavobacterium sp. JP2137 TaxID=3414510 RepID=UPI003D30089C
MINYNFYKLLFYCCLFLNFCVYGQTINTDEISKKVGEFNNAGKYEQTISLLEKIIANPKSTSYDSYQAYYLKHLTYKRLFNYQEAQTNLDLALIQGLKTDQKKQIAAQIKFEKLFIFFDLLNFKEVEKLLNGITQNELELVDSNALAFYYIIQGTMEIRKSRFDEANQYYATAIRLLEITNPQHLPLIYRKKIDLYRKIKRYDLALESFEKGLFYAKKYNVDIYIINMYFDLSHFYQEIGDYKKAVETQEICNKLVAQFDQGSTVGKLNIIENRISQERIEKKKEKSFRYLLVMLFIGSIFTAAFALLIRYLLRLKRKKNVAIADQNDLNGRLVALIGEVENQDVKPQEQDLPPQNLTERQNELVELIKMGKTNKEIALILFISENTVKYHLKNIYQLLNVKSRIEI